MQRLSDDAVRNLAGNAAELLATEDGRRLYRTLHALDLLRHDACRPPEIPIQSVGPYKGNGTGALGFVTSGVNPHWWGLAKEVRVRKEVKRCVLLGESVARGFFFDPVHTPASMLSQALNGASDESYEVIDLAATNATLNDLMRLLDEIPLLEPDVVVIWAGNNWSGLSQIALSPGLALLAAGCESYLELSRQAKSSMESEFNRFEKRIQELSSSSVSVIVVVPAVNHETWQRDSLYGRRYSEDAISASTQDDAHELRVAPPGCSQHIQDLLRSLAGPRIRVVDLPKLIAESVSRGLQGDVFLDYCHHSWRGLTLAVDAIAQSVFGENSGITFCQEASLEPRHAAVAYSLAAVHADAWAQDEGVVRELLLAARSLWPPAIEVAVKYLDMSLCSGYVGWKRFCAEAENIGGQQVTRYFGSGAPGQSLRPTLRRALARINALPPSGTADQDLLDRHLLHSGLPRDLLERPYSTPHAKSLHLLEQCIYLRSRAASQKFSLLLRQPGDVRLRIRCRACTSGYAKLLIDGERVADLNVTEEWYTAELELPRIAGGLHDLEVAWHCSSRDASVSIREFAEAALNSNQFATPLPVMGEIAVLVATLQYGEPR